MIIKLYNFLLFIGWPLINHHLKNRLKKGKETPESLKEKQGNFSFARPKGKLIWLHVASVGEAISIIPLAEKAKEINNCQILITSATLTSAKLLRQRLSDKMHYHHLPFDKLSYVQKFLQHFSPNIAMFCESEIWPNFINESKKANIPLFLISARISPKSNLKKQIHGFFLKNILKNFTLITPQDNYTYNYLKRITQADKITPIANLKKAPRPNITKQNELKLLRESTKSRNIILAASTHIGEEEIMLDCHQQLKTRFPKLLTIIAARHPQRSEEIRTSCKQSNLTYALRSKKEAISQNLDIYIVDTLGELDLFYNLAEISFIGGSLAKIGGHNPLEALKANTAIIHGPHIANFQEIYDELDNKNICLKVRNKEELTAQISRLLNDPKETQKLIAKSKEFNAENEEIIEHYLNIIKTYLQ